MFDREVTALWRRIVSRDIVATLREAEEKRVSLLPEEKAVALRFVEACKQTGGLKSVAADSLLEVEERLKRQ